MVAAAGSSGRRGRRFESCHRINVPQAQRPQRTPNNLHSASRVNLALTFTGCRAAAHLDVCLSSPDAMMTAMTSVMSLFSCAFSDVTYERVQELVQQGMPESLTLEYKQQYTDKIPTSIAAMANTYGGIVLVGVAEGGANRLVGVPEDTITRIVNACHGLEPPWQPEIVPVQLPSRPDSFILVVRIDSAQAPRPLLQRGAAPIRLHGRNSVADRSRLESLFGQASVAQNVSRFQVPAPQISYDSSGEPEADFIVSTGLAIPLSNDAAWRPLSERGVGNLASSLNGSPLCDRLQGWNREIAREQFKPFSLAGLNRSRHARLSWRSEPDLQGVYPIEAVATASIPETYGQNASFLQFTVHVTVRESAFRRLLDGTNAQAATIEVDDLRGLLQYLCLTLPSKSSRNQGSRLSRAISPRTPRLSFAATSPSPTTPDPTRNGIRPRYCSGPPSSGPLSLRNHESPTAPVAPLRRRLAASALRTERASSADATWRRCASCHGLAAKAGGHPSFIPPTATAKRSGPTRGGSSRHPASETPWTSTRSNGTTTGHTRPSTRRASSPRAPTPQGGSSRTTKAGS
jgi:hypothetical protein